MKDQRRFSRSQMGCLSLAIMSTVIIYVTQMWFVVITMPSTLFPNGSQSGPFFTMWIELPWILGVLLSGCALYLALVFLPRTWSPNAIVAVATGITFLTYTIIPALSLVTPSAFNHGTNIIEFIQAVYAYSLITTIFTGGSLPALLVPLLIIPRKGPKYYERGQRPRSTYDSAGWPTQKSATIDPESDPTESTARQYFPRWFTEYGNDMALRH